MKRKLKINYRFIPINVFFPPEKKKTLVHSTTPFSIPAIPAIPAISTPFIPLVWKNEYEITCRPYYHENPLLQPNCRHQCHFLIRPVWIHLDLLDEDGLGECIDSDGWIGVHTPMGRRFSPPKHIHTIKTFLRALVYLYQNPNTYLCMDTMTKSLCLCVDGKEEDDDKEEKELNIYRLQIIRTVS
uniref:Uncharacterized protein n=1 Tax=viral metagenome TaxID=1070528 RepID=A0A6C0D0Q6_9ZZZZ